MVDATQMDRSRLASTILLTGTLVFAGCAGTPLDQIDLMPAPDVYGDGLLNPLPVEDPFDTLADSSLKKLVRYQSWLLLLSIRIPYFLVN